MSTAASAHGERDGTGYPADLAGGRLQLHPERRSEPLDRLLVALPHGELERREALTVKPEAHDQHVRSPSRSCGGGQDQLRPLRVDELAQVGHQRTIALRDPTQPEGRVGVGHLLVVGPRQPVQGIGVASPQSAFHLGIDAIRAAC
jgi:hypothetical protein